MQKSINGLAGIFARSSMLVKTSIDAMRHRWLFKMDLSIFSKHILKQNIQLKYFLWHYIVDTCSTSTDASM